MKIVFMGTPDFAAGILDAIVKAGYDVVGVVTQPDKPKGRRKEPVACPVKRKELFHVRGAAKHALPLPILRIPVVRDFVNIAHAA